jgi:hypothetical protein
VHAATCGLFRYFFRKPRFSNSRLARDEKQPAAAADRLVEAGSELGKLAFASDE